MFLLDAIGKNNNKLNFIDSFHFGAYPREKQCENAYFLSKRKFTKAYITEERNVCDFCTIAMFYDKMIRQSSPVIFRVIS